MSNVVNAGCVMCESDGGHIQINPFSFDSLIRLNGKAVSFQPENYRIVTSNGRGQFWRFDGSNLYLMFTKPGDPFGSWNDLRPITVSYDTGQVTLNSVSTGSLSIGGAVVSANGNIDGSTVIDTASLMTGAISHVTTGSYSVAAQQNQLITVGVHAETDVTDSAAVKVGQALAEKIGQLLQSIADTRQEIIAPVVWIGSEWPS